MPDASDAGSREQALREFVARTRTSGRQSGIDAAAAEAVSALHGDGVQPVLLKGPAVAQTLYGPGEHRSYFDIDLLVGPDVLSAAARTLTGLGYANYNDLQGLRPVGESLHAQLWTRTIPGFGNQSIDLHWRMEGCGVDPGRAWSILTRELGSLEVGGCTVAILAPPAFALHLALHAAQHGPEDVKAARDLERGLDRLTPAVWREARQLAKELDALLHLSAGLALSARGRQLASELGLPSPGPVLDSLERRDSRPRGTFHLQAFRDGGTRERAQLIRDALVPPREWLTWQYPWARRGPVALALVYAFHIVRAPLWAWRAWRYDSARSRSES